MSAQKAGGKRGDMLVAVSSADGPNAEYVTGVLDAYSVTYPNNPSQNVMQFLSEISYGSSGGGVYTADGVWIGSVSRRGYIRKMLGGSGRGHPCGI